MRKTKDFQCEQISCIESAIACCDHCDHWFCDEHGSPGGDRQVEDVGAVAYPSTCEVCREKWEAQYK